MDQSKQSQKELSILSSIRMKGKVFEERDDVIVLETSISLFEIPRQYISHMTKVEEGLVELTVNRNAQIVQKILVSPEDMIGVVSGTIFRPHLPYAGECDCSRCVCDCRCECDCSRCTSYPYLSADLTGDVVDLAGGRFFRSFTRRSR